MARCPDCNKFRSGEADIEVQNYEVESRPNGETAMFEFRVVLNCEECGTELREATTEHEVDLPEKCPHCHGEFQPEDENGEFKMSQDCMECEQSTDCDYYTIEEGKAPYCMKAKEEAEGEDSGKWEMDDEPEVTVDEEIRKGKKWYIIDGTATVICSNCKQPSEVAIHTEASSDEFEDLN